MKQQESGSWGWGSSTKVFSASQLIVHNVCSEQQQSNNGSVTTASCGDALPRNKRHGDDGKMSVNVACFAAAAVSGEKPSRLSLTKSTVCSPLRSLSPRHIELKKEKTCVLFILTRLSNVADVPSRNISTTLCT